MEKYIYTFLCWHTVSDDGSVGVEVYASSREEAEKKALEITHTQKACLRSVREKDIMLNDVNF